MVWRPVPCVDRWQTGDTRLGDLNRTDRDLVARIGAGDHDALAEAFRSYGGAVKSLALRVLRDETLAEDVVQDTFVWLWKSPERYDADRGSLRSLLLTVAHRRAVDTVRSEEARTRRESQPPEPTTSGVEEQVWATHLAEHVRTAVNGLSDNERDAISLAYFSGLTYVEVSQRLGSPEGTVKSRIRNGMRKLASSLEGMAS